MVWISSTHAGYRYAWQIAKEGNIGLNAEIVKRQSSIVKRET
jgi:hypothetical protein